MISTQDITRDVVENDGRIITSMLSPCQRYVTNKPEHLIRPSSASGLQPVIGYLLLVLGLWSSSFFFNMSSFFFIVLVTWLSLINSMGRSTAFCDPRHKTFQDQFLSFFFFFLSSSYSKLRSNKRLKAQWSPVSQTSTQRAKLVKFE